ncbi:hypothetical protein ACC754_40820, partial [Rhizobium johnstonii]
MDKVGIVIIGCGNISGAYLTAMSSFPILDQIGDDADRLPVDADRQGELRQHVAAEIGDDEDHPVGGD